MEEWSDGALTLLPVIAAHANRKDEAWPSYATISALASIGKSTVKKALDELVEKEWLEKTKQHRNNTHNSYRLSFSYDKENDDKNYKRQWMRLDHKLILMAYGEQ